MAKVFAYSELSIDDQGRRIILSQDGVSYLRPRRPIPIPRESSNFSTFILPRPMTATEVSYAIYKTTDVWGLLVEWNALPDPASWCVRRLPQGFKVRHMTTDRYKRFVTRVLRPTLSGVGDITE